AGGAAGARAEAAVSGFAVVVLAAGGSTRMGRPKALLPVGDTTFAGLIVRTAQSAGAAEIVFVLGPPHGELIRPGLPPGVRTAWNADPGRGMLSSIQTGIAALQQP